MVKAVLFDLGGVVVNNIFGRVQRELSARADIPYDEVKEVRKRYWLDYELGRMDAQEFWGKIFSDLGVGGSIDVDEFIAHTISLIHIKEDTLDLIKELRKDHKLVMVTNNCDEWSDHSQNDLGLGDFFDVWICSSKIHIKKPDAEIYLKAAESVGVRPEDCVFIDDKQRNIDGAEKAGMKGFLFTDSASLRSDLKDAL